MFVEILKGYFSIFASPQILIMLILLIVFYMRNAKEANVRRIILGDSEDSPLVLTLYQMIYGIAGGFAISVMAGVFNIAFNSYMEVQIIFLLTVFAVTRFSGYVNIGVNVMAVFLAGYLLNQDVIPVLDLVNLYLFLGLLYIVHGLMLILDRRHGFLPVLFSRNGVIRGGFKVDKIYLLPAAVGFYTASGIILGASVFYLTLFHLFHVQETVMSFSKKQAILILGGLKMLAGSLILAGSVLVSYDLESVYLLIILVPLLVYAEKMAFRLMDSRRKAFFTSDQDQIMVLEVRENTPAYRSGLRSGDRILSLNGTEDPTYKSLMAFMGTLHYERGVHLLVQDLQKVEKMVKFTIAKDTSTGIIIVPPSDALALPDKENA